MEWSNKDIAQTFYTKIELRPNLHQCHLCGDAIKQKVATGYTNLINHLKARHPRYREELEATDGIVSSKKMYLMDSLANSAPDTEKCAIENDLSASSASADNDRMVNRALECQSMTTFFFEKIDEDHYRCKQLHCRRVYAQRRGTGFTNLKYHLRICIGPNFESKFKQEGFKTSQEESLFDQNSMKKDCQSDSNLCEEDTGRLDQDDEVILSEYMQKKGDFPGVRIEKKNSENNSEENGDKSHDSAHSSEDKQERIQSEKVVEGRTDTERSENSSNLSRTKRNVGVVERSQSSSCEEIGGKNSKRSKTSIPYKRRNDRTNELLDIHQAMIHKIIDTHERSLMKFLQFEREEREKDRLAHMQIMTTMIKAFVRPHE
ncbi:unnamed protein product [Albugo candida]|uniref:BED-type domain-containing protein n=1 Tax=Albugo candida TaxID=65357 RepID=A0A024GP68_9STRA|nr:unnamed protein product [Albugo candida]|eukprot:CCI48512.1 unnamed protein product [Albugo candida]